MRVRYRVLGMLSLLSVITYLDRVCTPRRRRSADSAGSSAATPQMWGWILGAFTLGYSFFEIPSGALGGSLRPRVNADAHRALVVRADRIDRRGFPCSKRYWRDSFPVRCGGGGGAPSQYHHLHFALVSSCGAGPGPGRRVDGQPYRRRAVAPAGRGNSKIIWMARLVLVLRPSRSNLGVRLVRICS